MVVRLGPGDYDSEQTPSDENSTTLMGLKNDDFDKEFPELSSMINLNDRLKTSKSSSNQKAAYRNPNPSSLSSVPGSYMKPSSLSSYSRAVHETKDIREKFMRPYKGCGSSYSKTFCEAREVRKFYSIS